jgi:hypothetical protein
MRKKGNLVKIGGKPLSGVEAHRVVSRAGPFPAFTPIVTNQAADKALQAGDGFIELQLDVSYFDSREDTRMTATISKLWALPTSLLIGNHKPQWLITDRRFFLRKLVVAQDFSMRRPVNEFKQLQDGPLDQFNRTPKLAFLPHTQRAEGSSLFDQRFNAADNSESTGEPWTAFQACIYLCQNWISSRPYQIFPDIPQGQKPTLIIDGTDNRRIMAGFRAASLTWPQAMKRLLRAAHCGLSIEPGGQFRIYDLDPVDIGHLGGFDGAPKLRLQDNTRERPRKLRVLFKAEREIRFDYLENSGDQQDLNQTAERTRLGNNAAKRDVQPSLRNVIILPRDIRPSNENRLYQRGTIVDIEKFFELVNNDSLNPLPATYDQNGRPGGPLRVGFDFLHRFIMSPALAAKLTFEEQLNRVPDPVLAATAALFYQNYRTLYQINPAFLDFIETMRGERTAIADPVTGKRAKSTVVCDHFILRTARYFGLPNQLASQNRDAGTNVYGWSGSLQGVTDFEKLPFKDGQPSHYQVRIINKNLGLIQIKAVPDLHGQISRIIPAVFNPDEIPYVAAGGGNIWELQQMRYLPQFRLSTILTCTLRAPNDAGRYWVVDKGQIGNGQGPVEERLFSGMHAGIEWVDQADPEARQGNQQAPIQPSRFEVDPVSGQLIAEGGRLINASVINDIADSQAKDAEFENRDRHIGTVRHPGIDTDFRPLGQVNQVAIEYQSGKINTVYDANYPEQDPPLWELLNTTTQAYLFRLEEENIL